MESDRKTAATQGGRVQWGSYGFIAGVVFGLFMGWMFAGFVGAFVRVALVAAILVPAILLYLGWRRYVSPWLKPPAKPDYIGPVGAIETRAVVRGIAHEPHVR
jgi:membrane protein implicated in regulation of membrane protease activity